MTSLHYEGQSTLDRWNRFLFAPAGIHPIARVRGLLCLIAAVDFLGSLADAPFWFSDGGPLSSTRVSTFLQTGGLEDRATWIVSPLFLTDNGLVYQLYLAISVVICAVVAAGRGGRAAPWGLWLLFVGWANRGMIVAGLAETLLSLGLFASAIAPPSPAWARTHQGTETKSWLAGFATRLMSIQISVIGVATFVTMLGGRVWFNGLGAYALAAPVQNRAIDWTTHDWFVNLHELVTHAMVIALPAGFLLAWNARTNRTGKGILVLWCFAVALLGSHWLYSAAFATMVLAISPIDEAQSPD